jgi:hypothetical protein
VIYLIIAGGTSKCNYHRALLTSLQLNIESLLFLFLSSINYMKEQLLVPALRELYFIDSRSSAVGIEDNFAFLCLRSILGFNVCHCTTHDFLEHKLFI